MSSNPVSILASYDFALREATFDVLGVVSVISNPDDIDNIWLDYSQTGDVFSLCCILNAARDRAWFYVYATEKIQGQDITLFNHFIYIGTAQTGETPTITFDYDFNTFDALVSYSDGNVTQTIPNPNTDTLVSDLLDAEGSELTKVEIEIVLGGNQLNCEVFLYPIQDGIRDQKSEFRIGELVV